jgi:hypothetical protein
MFKKNAQDLFSKNYPDYVRYHQYLDFLLEIIKKDPYPIKKSQELLEALKGDPLKKPDGPRAPPMWLDFLCKGKIGFSLIQSLSC